MDSKKHFLRCEFQCERQKPPPLKKEKLTEQKHPKTPSKNDKTTKTLKTFGRPPHLSLSAFSPLELLGGISLLFEQLSEKALHQATAGPGGSASQGFLPGVLGGPQSNKSTVFCGFFRVF